MDIITATSNNSNNKINEKAALTLTLAGLRSCQLLTQNSEIIATAPGIQEQYNNNNSVNSNRRSKHTHKRPKMCPLLFPMLNSMRSASVCFDPVLMIILVVKLSF